MSPLTWITFIPRVFYLFTTTTLQLLFDLVASERLNRLQFVPNAAVATTRWKSSREGDGAADKDGASATASGGGGVSGGGSSGGALMPRLLPHSPVLHRQLRDRHRDLLETVALQFLDLPLPRRGAGRAGERNGSAE